MHTCIGIAYLQSIGSVTSMTCGASTYLPPDSARPSISETIFSRMGTFWATSSITSESKPVSKQVSSCADAAKLLHFLYCWSFYPNTCIFNTVFLILLLLHNHAPAPYSGKGLLWQCLCVYPLICHQSWAESVLILWHHQSPTAPVALRLLIYQ